MSTSGTERKTEDATVPISWPLDSLPEVHLDPTCEILLRISETTKHTGLAIFMDNKTLVDAMNG